MFEKGKFVDGIILIACFVLCVIAAYAYLRKEDTDYKEVRENTLELNRVIQEQKKVADATANMLTLFSRRIETLEGKKPQNAILPHSLNLHMKEPVTVNVVYVSPTKKADEVLPMPPKKLKTKTPLLKRAGIEKGN